MFCQFLFCPWPAGSLILPQTATCIQTTSPTMSAAVAAASAPKTLGEAFSEPSTVKKKSGYDVPWVERYRPQKLADVVGNEETLVRLSAIARDGNMPNLILSGPPGTGKVRSCSCINGCWVIINVWPIKGCALVVIFVPLISPYLAD